MTGTWRSGMKTLCREVWEICDALERHHAWSELHDESASRIFCQLFTMEINVSVLSGAGFHVHPWALQGNADAIEFEHRSFSTGVDDSDAGQFAIEGNHLG